MESIQTTKTNKEKEEMKSIPITEEEHLSNINTIKDDNYKIAAGGCCSVFTTQHITAWKRILEKVYFNTTDPKDPEIFVLWSEENGKLAIAYNNKRANFEVYFTLFDTGKMNIQGKVCVIKQWHEVHYPCILNNLDIVGITDTRTQLRPPIESNKSVNPPDITTIPPVNHAEPPSNKEEQSSTHSTETNNILYNPFTLCEIIRRYLETMKETNSLPSDRPSSTDLSIVEDIQTDSTTLYEENTSLKNSDEDSTSPLSSCYSSSSEFESDATVLAIENISKPIDSSDKIISADVNDTNSDNSFSFPLEMKKL